MHASPSNTIYDWKAPSGHVRRIHLQNEDSTGLTVNARIELDDGRCKELATGSSKAAHNLVRELCEALKAGTAAFEGEESAAAKPQWKPRLQPDGRVTQVYPKAKGFHQIVVDDSPDFRGGIRPSQSLFVADSHMAKTLAKAVAEGDLDITPTR